MACSVRLACVLSSSSGQIFSPLAPRISRGLFSFRAEIGTLLRLRWGLWKNWGMTYRQCPKCASERPTHEQFCGFCGQALPFVAPQDMPSNSPYIPSNSPLPAALAESAATGFRVVGAGLKIAALVIGLLCVAVVILALVKSAGEDTTAFTSGHHDVRFVGTWQDQRDAQRLGILEFHADGTGIVYSDLGNGLGKSAEFQWADTNGSSLVQRHRSLLKPDPGWGRELSSRVTFYAGGTSFRSEDEFGGTTYLRIQ